MMINYVLQIKANLLIYDENNILSNSHEFIKIKTKINP